MLLGVVESRKQQIFDQNKYVFEGVLLGYKQVRQLEWLGTGIDGKCAQQWERGAGPGVRRLAVKPRGAELGTSLLVSSTLLAGGREVRT